MSKAALITGGAKRVGREIALALAEQGYDIALHYFKSQAEAQTLKKEIEAMGRKAQIFSFDLVDTQAIEPWICEIAGLFPALELLVNNASIFERTSFADSTVADFTNHMAINAAAPIFLTKAFAKHVKHGQVINLLDTNITDTHGSHFFYLLSKKTLADFTRMAARELGPQIRVNAVCPGVVLPSDQQPMGYEENLAKRLPMAEQSSVEDIVRAVNYLLDATHITGQLLFTDSGQHLL